MTLTEIKDKITESLKMLTIDDFYADPNIPLAIFRELTNQTSYGQIKTYLMEKFPVSSVETKRYALRQTIEDLNDRISTIQDEKLTSQTSNYAELKTIQTTLKKTQKELEQLDEKDNTHFENEYSSLEFLFKALLKKSMRKSEYMKGEVELKDCSFEEYEELVLSYTTNKNVIPGEWRKLLYQILSTPLPNLSGYVSLKSPYHVGGYDYFNRIELKLTNKDISSLLATKMAVRSNYSVRTADNKIILGLSGGLSATITFREKGELISKLQKQKFEIYSNCYDLRSDRYVTHTLYHQTGYAGSTIGIETPGAFYLLFDKYVVEIEFNAAPILFDANSIIKFAPNISGKAKREDEIAEEEERKRQQEEDDYYYDFND